MRRMRGDSARIIRRKALLIEMDPASTEADKLSATSYRDRAALSRSELVAANGLHIVHTHAGTSCDAACEDSTYDQLVCGYYR